MSIQIKYSWILFKEKIFCKKTGWLLVLQFFVIYMFCKPLILFSETMSYPVMPLIYPFIMADTRYLFLFVLGVAYHFSDVPFMQQEGMYQTVRLGRIRWGAGQILAIVFRSFFLIIANVIFCCVILIRHIEFGTEWGKLLHTLALTDAGKNFNLWFRIPYETINQFTPLQLTALTILICGLTLSFLALIMFAISIYAGRPAAILTIAIMDILVYFLSNVHVMARQDFSKYIPISWMRVAELNVKSYNYFQLPPLSYIGFALALGIAGLIIAIIWRVLQMEFQWKKEES